MIIDRVLCIVPQKLSSQSGQNFSKRIKISHAKHKLFEVQDFCFGADET